MSSRVQVFWLKRVMEETQVQLICIENSFAKRLSWCCKMKKRKFPSFVLFLLIFVACSLHFLSTDRKASQHQACAGRNIKYILNAETRVRGESLDVIKLARKTFYSFCWYLKIFLSSTFSSLSTFLFTPAHSPYLSFHAVLTNNHHLSCAVDDASTWNSI